MMVMCRNNNVPDLIDQNLAQAVVEVQPEATSTPKVHEHHGPNNCKDTKSSISAFLKNLPVKVLGGRCLSV